MILRRGSKPFLLTDHCDVADSLPGSSAVLHHHHVSAAVLPLRLHQAKRHGGQRVLEHDVLVGLQLIVVSVPHDGGRRFTGVAALQQAALAHAENYPIAEVQLNGGRLCEKRTQGQSQILSSLRGLSRKTKQREASVLTQLVLAGDGFGGERRLAGSDFVDGDDPELVAVSLPQAVVVVLPLHQLLFRHSGELVFANHTRLQDVHCDLRAAVKLWCLPGDADQVLSDLGDLELLGAVGHT